MSEALTTLQLAERIFDAVAHAIENGTAGSEDESPGAVVLQVIYEAGYALVPTLPFDQP